MSVYDYYWDDPSSESQHSYEERSSQRRMKEHNWRIQRWEGDQESVDPMERLQTYSNLLCEAAPKYNFTYVSEGYVSTDDPGAVYHVDTEFAFHKRLMYRFKDLAHLVIFDLRCVTEKWNGQVETHLGVEIDTYSELTRALGLGVDNPFELLGHCPTGGSSFGGVHDHPGRWDIRNHFSSNDYGALADPEALFEALAKQVDKPEIVLAELPFFSNPYSGNFAPSYVFPDEELFWKRFGMHHLLKLMPNFTRNLDTERWQVASTRERLRMYKENKA